MQSDLNLFCLPDELLLDFEPGLTQTVVERLEKYIIADDVQVVDIAPLFGLLSIQGRCAATVVQSLQLGCELPAERFSFAQFNDPVLGEVYLANHPRLHTSGFDFFAGGQALPDLAARLETVAGAA